MIVNRSAVAPPINQPFSFPFRPEIKPPINKAKNEIVISIQPMEDSSSFVNFNNEERMALVIRAIMKIVMRPLKIAFPQVFVPKILSPLRKYIAARLDKEYSL